MTQETVIKPPAPGAAANGAARPRGVEMLTMGPHRLTLRLTFPVIRRCESLMNRGFQASINRAAFDWTDVAIVVFLATEGINPFDDVDALGQFIFEGGYQDAANLAVANLATAYFPAKADEAGKP